MENKIKENNTKLNKEMDKIYKSLENEKNSKNDEKINFLSKISFEKKNGKTKTGSKKLDVVTKEFIPGILTEIYGSSNTGKTQIAFQIAVNTAKIGKNIIFIDTTGNFRPERIADMAIAQNLEQDSIMEKIFVIKCLSIEHQINIINIINNFLKTKKIDLIVIDEISRNFLQGDERSGIILKSLLNLHLHKLSHMAYDLDIPILVINTTRTKINKEHKIETTTLNSIINRIIHFKIHLKNINDERYAENEYGNKCIFKITKEGIKD
jgi:RecA/RadA recombinase